MASEAQFAQRRRRRVNGGLARGRQLSAQRARAPRQRTRQRALALRYPQRQPIREQIEELYLADGGRSDGAETFALIVIQDWKLVRQKGVHAATTGPRRAQGLAKAGHGRVPRTVRRHRARAVRLGLAAYPHVKRQRATDGAKDYLRVEMYTKMSTCLRQQEQALHSACAPASARCARSDSTGSAGRDHRPAAPARAAPPYGGSAGCAGEERHHSGGGGPSPTERIAFLQAQLALAPSERQGPTTNTTKKLESDLLLARFEAANPGCWEDPYYTIGQGRKS